jgi:hypothetical protein
LEAVQSAGFVQAKLQIARIEQAAYQH